MRILRAAAHNAKGFEEFSEEFSDVNVISGFNGSGKSTILDILSALFVTDGDRQLLKAGATEGWLSCTIEDEVGVIEIRRNLTPAGVGKPTIKRSDGTTVGAYAEFIKRIVDTVTMDPIRKVMSASPKEQAAILLDTVPLELDHAELAGAVASLDGLRDLPAIVQNARKLPALDAIKAVEDYVYDSRRDINRDAKLKKAHAGELRAALGQRAASDTDWAASAQRLLEQMTSQAEEEGRLRLIEEQRFAHEREVAASGLQSALDDVDRDFDAQIAQLNQLRESAKRVCRTGHEQDLNLRSTAHDERLDAIEAGQRPVREHLKVEHSQATANAAESSNLSATKRLAEQNEADAKALEGRSQAMSTALDAMRTLRDKLLEKLPIPGLRVEGGRAYLDGVPLEEVNTAAQGEFWIRIGVMRAVKKALAIILIEDSEHFDTKTFPRILEQCRATGLQFFITRVEPHDLKIERYESTV